MSLFDQLIPRYTLNDNRQIRVAPQMPEPVYIDDAFDPLFNKRAKAYLNAKYGRFLGIPAGYAEMIENMLGNSTKQWGPLGPGMGILGTFGRTIDKAEDFLLGGITEASHLAGNLNPLGSYTPVKNPLKEVFVEDKDYTGQKLLASMANNMSKLAGGTSLTENDFTGAWNVPSLGIEIATDPGILGGALSRHLAPTVALYDDAGVRTIAPLQKASQNGAVSSREILDMLSKETNVKSAVGEAGQLMSNFDDVLSKISWDMSAPGLRQGIGKLLNRIDTILPADRMNPYVDVVLKQEEDELAKRVEDIEKNMDTVSRKEIPETVEGVVDTAQIGSHKFNIDNSDELNYTLNKLVELKRALRKTKATPETKAHIKKIDELTKRLSYAKQGQSAQELLNNYRSKTLSKFGEEGYIPVTEQIEKYQSDKLKKSNDFIENFTKNTYLEEGKNIPKIKKPADFILEDGDFMPSKNQIDEVLEDIKEKRDLLLKDKFDEMSEDEFKNLYPGSNFEKMNEISKELDFWLDTDDETLNNYLKDNLMTSYKDLDTMTDEELFFALRNRSENLPDFSEQSLKYNRLKNLKEILNRGTNETELIKKFIQAENIFNIPNSPVVITSKNFANKLDVIYNTPLIDEVNKRMLKTIKELELPEDMAKDFMAGNFYKLKKYIKEAYPEYYNELKLALSNADVSKDIDFWRYSTDKELNHFLQNPLEYKYSKEYLDSLDESEWHYLFNNPENHGYLKNLSHKELQEMRKSKIEELLENSTQPYYKNFKDTPDAKTRWFQNFDTFYNWMNAGNDYASDEVKELLDTLTDIKNIFNSIDIGQESGILSSYSKALNDLYKTEYSRGYNIWTKIVNGKPTFNYDKYYDLKKNLEMFDVNLNPQALKETYGLTIEDVNKYLEDNYPPIGNTIPDFEMYVAKNKREAASIEYLLNATHSNKNIDSLLYKPKSTWKNLKNLEDNKDWILKHATELDNIISNSTPETIQILLDGGTKVNPNTSKVIEAVSEVTKETPKQVAETLENIKHYDGPQDPVVSFYTKLDNITNNVYVKNSNKNTYASVRFVKSKLNRMDEIKANTIAYLKAANPKLGEKSLEKAWREIGAEYLSKRDAIIGDIVTKDKFIKEFIDARGIFIGRAKIGQVGNLQKAIENNARVLNKNARIVIPFSKQIGDYMYVGLKLNTAEKDIINLFNKHVKIDGMEDLQDVIFAFKDNTVDLSKFKNIHPAMNDINESAANLYKTMGFKDATIDYTKHKYIFTKDGEIALSNLYKQLGIDNIQEIRQCGGVLQEMYNKHGAFMTFNTAKSLRGNIADWNSLAPIFETDLTKIAKSTFTDGIFDNQKVQAFIDLCLNDNTKVSSWAKDWQDLKRIINAKDAYGKASGNLKNMVLASAVFDEETGAFLKFKKYDMLTDKGIQEAFSNNAFYVPTNMFAMLDKMIKKDAKMSNKLYGFVNKFLILPFKFGTLANPGFLVGNFSDAYMKQALTLSQKYGTSVAEEFTNVAESLADIVHLNNTFDEIYRNKFLVSIGEQAIKENPYLKISSKVFDDPKVSERFINWYKANRDLLPKVETDNVDLMLYINRYIPTMTGNLTAFDLEDVAKYSKGSKFEQPKSFVEKRLMGNHYDPKNITTWGLFAGNPISNTVMRYSGDIETLFRSASVLNDLKHYYKDKDNLIKTIGLDPEEFAKRHQELSAKTLDAINLMNAANFNYDNISDFMQKVSYVMPFPTFYLKNIGYWLEVLEEHPEYIDTIVNTQNTMWHGIDTTKDNFQAEAKGRGSLPMSSIIGQKPSKVFKGVLKPTMTNSMFSAFSTINNPIKDIANRLTPAAAAVTRHLQEPENVRYRPYSTDPYEKNIKQGDKNFNKLTYTFHRLNPYDRFLNTYLRTPAKIKTNQAQMSDFLPSIFQPDYSRKEKAKK